MAFQTGTANSHDDFFTKLGTFIEANGWTRDELDTVTNNRAAWHDTAGDSIYFQVRWDESDEVAFFQSLSHDGSAPGSNPNDSGNGDEFGTIDSERRWNEVGDFTSTVNYWFLTDTSPEPYLYVVVEYSPGEVRHFWAGKLEKKGTWTGGEFVCGHYWHQVGGVMDSPSNQNHSMATDGAYSESNSPRAGTIHVEGLSSQAAAGKYGVFVSEAATSLGTDGDGNARVKIIGGVRGGSDAQQFGNTPGDTANAAQPLIPIQVWYYEELGATDAYRLLGSVPNARQINVENFNLGQELIVGSDIWIVFPWVRKRWQQDNQNESGNLGFAYKKTT